MVGLLRSVAAEAQSAVEEWGCEHPVDGTGGPDADRAADTMRQAVAQAFAEGKGTWRALLMERVLEAFTLQGHSLRDELLSVAGLSIAWADDLDRREQAQPHPSLMALMKSSG